METANKNLLKLQTVPIDSIKEKNKQIEVVPAFRKSTSRNAPSKRFVEQRFQHKYNNEQLTQNQKALTTSQNYSTYLKEQKHNLKTKLKNGEKLTSYEKVLVKKERDRPTILNAYQIFSTKNSDIRSAVKNMDKELESRSKMEKNYENRIERYNNNQPKTSNTEIAKKDKDNLLERFSHKTQLKESEVKKLKEYRNEQKLIAGSGNGDKKKEAEVNVKKADKLLERTIGKNENLKQKNKEEEITINR